MAPKCNACLCYMYKKIKGGDVKHSQLRDAVLNMGYECAPGSRALCLAAQWWVASQPFHIVLKYSWMT